MLNGIHCSEPSIYLPSHFSAHAMGNGWGQIKALNMYFVWGAPNILSKYEVSDEFATVYTFSEQRKE